MIQLAAFLALPAVSFLIAALARLEASIEADLQLAFRPTSTFEGAPAPVATAQVEPAVADPSPAQLDTVIDLSDDRSPAVDPAPVRALLPSAGA
jgi:hypothetical protein